MNIAIPNYIEQNGNILNPRLLIVGITFCALFFTLSTFSSLHNVFIKYVLRARRNRRRRPRKIVPPDSICIYYKTFASKGGTNSVAFLLCFKTVWTKSCLLVVFFLNSKLSSTRIEGLVKACFRLTKRHGYQLMVETSSPVILSSLRRAVGRAINFFLYFFLFFRFFLCF